MIISFEAAMMQDIFLTCSIAALHYHMSGRGRRGPNIPSRRLLVMSYSVYLLGVIATTKYTVSTQLVILKAFLSILKAVYQFMNVVMVNIL